MLTAALIIGIVVSLLLAELVGLSAGIIVPGYVALLLDRPAALGGFLVVALATHGIVLALGTQLMLFGTRRFTVTLLTGMTLSVVAQMTLPLIALSPIEWAGLGYIVPGLLAHQFDRQGIAPTLAVLAIAAGIVRVILVVAVRP